MPFALPQRRSPGCVVAKEACATPALGSAESLSGTVSPGARRARPGQARNTILRPNEWLTWDFCAGGELEVEKAKRMIEEVFEKAEVAKKEQREKEKEWKQKKKERDRHLYHLRHAKDYEVTPPNNPPTPQHPNTPAPPVLFLDEWPLASLCVAL